MRFHPLSSTFLVLLLPLSNNNNNVNGFSFLLPTKKTTTTLHHAIPRSLSFANKKPPSFALSAGKGPNLPPTGPGGKPASNPEEDLELTRQIIMTHIDKFYSPTETEDDEDEEKGESEAKAESKVKEEDAEEPEPPAEEESKEEESTKEKGKEVSEDDIEEFRTDEFYTPAEAEKEEEETKVQEIDPKDKKVAETRTEEFYAPAETETEEEETAVKTEESASKEVTEEDVEETRTDEFYDPAEAEEGGEETEVKSKDVKETHTDEFYTPAEEEEVKKKAEEDKQQEEEKEDVEEARTDEFYSPAEAEEGGEKTVKEAESTEEASASAEEGGEDAKAETSEESKTQMKNELESDSEAVDEETNEEETQEEEKEEEDDGWPENDLMIRTALGKSVEKTPVWLFRQAGRHLPEYKEYKEKVGRSFLDMLNYPEDVAECTMQPLRRYNVDAAILFSDILVIAQALNVRVTMPGGVGIQVPEPLKDPSDMAERIPKMEEINKAFVLERLGHVMESVKLIRQKMKDEGKSLPLIGFSAAPWTLLFYMVGGSSKKNTDFGMKWLKDHPEDSRQLLQLLTKIVVEYCSCQIEAGCHMVQIFEAMGMMIEEEEFREFALPCLEEISGEMKRRFPEVPLMVFSRGASFANEALSKLDYDIVTIDGTVDRTTARTTVPSTNAGLQGNYDPKELIVVEDNSKTPETVRQTVKEMLEALGPQRLIANLGEGLGGKESPELVKAFVDAVHEESEVMIREQ